MQKSLYSEWIIKELNNNKFIFTKDYLFKSPSASASLILSRRANWWLEWKDKNWKTLDENERSNLN